MRTNVGIKICSLFSVTVQGLGCFVALPSCEFRGQLGEQVVGVGTAAGLCGWGRWPVVSCSATFPHLPVEGAATRGASWESQFIRSSSIADALSGGTWVPLIRRQRRTAERQEGTWRQLHFPLSFCLQHPVAQAKSCIFKKALFKNSLRAFCRLQGKLLTSALKTLTNRYDMMH